MKRHICTWAALAALVASAPLQLASAEGFGGGFGRGHGGRGLGVGIGIGGYSDIFGYAELYRELYNNLPYFALHPPVYYSYPVPRTYGYSPFAYPGYVMTPEIAGPIQPLDIINPHVTPKPDDKPADAPADRAAKSQPRVQPLVVVNPFVGSGQAVATIEVKK